MWRIIVLFPVLLSACTEFPALDGKTSAAALAASYPKLVPLNELLAPQTEPRLTQAEVDKLLARVARLKRRAAALRRPVFDNSARIKLQTAINR